MLSWWLESGRDSLSWKRNWNLETEDKLWLVSPINLVSRASRLPFLQSESGVIHNWCPGASVCVPPQNRVVWHIEYPIYDCVYLAGFLITLSPNGPCASNSFFRPKTISKVAIIKTKSATIIFFLFSSFPSHRSFFFSFPFPALLWLSSFSALRNLHFDASSLKPLQISLDWFSKNRLDVVTPLGTVRRHFERRTKQWNASDLIKTVCTQGPGAHSCARMQILDVSVIGHWQCLKESAFTLVPSEYRARAPSPGIKYEPCLRTPEKGRKRDFRSKIGYYFFSFINCQVFIY